MASDNCMGQHSCRTLPGGGCDDTHHLTDKTVHSAATKSKFLSVWLTASFTHKNSDSQLSWQQLTGGKGGAEEGFSWAACLASFIIGNIRMWTWVTMGFRDQFAAGSVSLVSDQLLRSERS